MKKILLAFCVLLLISTVYAEWSKEKTIAFLRETELAVDPQNVGKTIKDFRMDMDCTILKLNIKMFYSNIFKNPDKLRQTVEIPNMQKIDLYLNGDKGVKVDSLGGVTPLTGRMLDETKLTAAMQNPATPWYKVFDKISIADELEERDGKKYVAVTGSFKPEKKLNPIKCLIDPDSKLTTYVFLKNLSEIGEFESVTHYTQFKKINGILMPVKFTQTMLNIQMEYTIKNFAVNQNIPDSIFEYKE